MRKLTLRGGVASTFFGGIIGPEFTDKGRWYSVRLTVC